MQCSLLVADVASRSVCYRASRSGSWACCHRPRVPICGMESAAADASCLRAAIAALPGVSREVAERESEAVLAALRANGCEATSTLHLLSYDDLAFPGEGPVVGAIGKGILRQLLGSVMTPSTPVARAFAVGASRSSRAAGSQRAGADSRVAGGYYGGTLLILSEEGQARAATRARSLRVESLPRKRRPRLLISGCACHWCISMAWTSSSGPARRRRTGSPRKLRKQRSAEFRNPLCWWTSRNSCRRGPARRSQTRTKKCPKKRRISRRR